MKNFIKNILKKIFCERLEMHKKGFLFFGEYGYAECVRCGAERWGKKEIS